MEQGPEFGLAFLQGQFRKFSLFDFFSQITGFPCNLPFQIPDAQGRREEEKGQKNGNQVFGDPGPTDQWLGQNGTEPFVINFIVYAVGNDDAQALIQNCQQFFMSLGHGKAEFLFIAG